MFGIELISTRRRRQLELAEHGLKLNAIRATLAALIAEVRDEREIFFESNLIPGEGITDQEDRDELKRLDRLLLDARAVQDHLEGLP